MSIFNGKGKYWTVLSIVIVCMSQVAHGVRKQVRENVRADHITCVCVQLTLSYSHTLSHYSVNERPVWGPKGKFSINTAWLSLNLCLLCVHAPLRKLHKLQINKSTWNQIYVGQHISKSINQSSQTFITSC